MKIGRVIIACVSFSILFASAAVYYVHQKNNSREAVLGDALGHMVEEVGGEGFSGKGKVEIGLPVLGGEYVVQAEVVVAGAHGFYVKAGDLSDQIAQMIVQQPGLAGYQEAFSAAAEKIGDRWIHITPEMLPSTKGESQQSCTAALQAISGDSNEKEQLKTLIRENQLITHADNDDKTRYHYIVDIERVTSVPQPSLTKLKEGCAGLLKGVNISQIELWASKKDRRFQRVRLHTSQGQITMTFDIISQDISNEIPDSAASSDELQQEIQLLFPSKL